MSAMRDRQPDETAHSFAANVTGHVLSELSRRVDVLAGSVYSAIFSVVTGRNLRVEAGDRTERPPLATTGDVTTSKWWQKEYELPVLPSLEMDTRNDAPERGAADHGQERSDCSTR
jgi:hypothetical protein